MRYTMCGICGFTGHQYNDNDQSVIKKMSSKIKHRGPDGEGYYVDDVVSLGFRRLSFLDLEKEGDQPMYNEDKNIIIVFNGEIYNYKPLREMLIEKGHVFSSTTDTEVIIHLYEEYKEKLLDHIRGMFAFTIYEKDTGKLFGARDFFGIKPYYYSEVDNQFIFSSEIKSILQHPAIQREVNPNALENYLTFQYSPLQETFFKGIYKLLPGHYFTYQDGHLMITKYFDINFEPSHGRLTKIVEDIDAALGDSIDHHMVSDVEIGSFLSSGVDSSLVASRFGGKQTFTVGFDYEKYNEIGYAKALSDSLGITNHSKVITTKEYWDALSKIQYHMDEPLADASAVALYFVSGIAKKHVKGVLSGEGADELFGGYNIYKEPMALATFAKLPAPLRKFLAFVVKKIPKNFKGKSFLIRASQTLEERFIGNAKIFSEEERKKLLKTTGDISVADITGPFYQKVSHCDDVTKMQYLDLHMWLVGDILLKADKMSMAHSLEVRVPYLDKEVYKVAMSVPTEHRVNKQNTKYAFRLSTRKYVKSEVASKKKLGFPVPIRIWLKEDKYYNTVKTAFESNAAQTYFNCDKLVALLDAHKAGEVDNSRKIWTIYMFLVWYHEYFEQEENVSVA